MTTWTEAEIREHFAKLGVWRRAGVRAPHKPLLAMYALARVLDPDAPRLVPFAEAEPIMKDLLDQFGRRRTRLRPLYPFWRLQADGIWEVPEKDDVTAAGMTTSGDPSPHALRQARGGFPDGLHACLRANPLLTFSLIEQLIRSHFPDSRRRELLDAIGLAGRLSDVELLVDQTAHALRFAVGRPRDPAFRKELIRAWRGRCAMCGFDARLKGKSIGLEAAHIQWHTAGGPDITENGLLLCTLHHHALDAGAIGLEADCRIKVSGDLSGGEATEQHLGRLHGQQLPEPAGALPPSCQYIEWHDREVFEG